MPQDAGNRRKVRAAALVAGDGAMLQAILDSMYFHEIPNFELTAVIAPTRDAYAMTRAINAGVPSFVVDPELFPNMTSHSMAVATKLRDMDVELVILAGYDRSLGVIPYQFKNRIIGTYPALYPAYNEEENADPVALALESGLKVTGVNVKVGDVVAEGDVLCTFDVSNAKEQLADVKDAQAKAEAAEAAGRKSAQRAYDNAVSSKNSSLEAAQAEIDAAKVQLDAANAALDEYPSDVETARQEVNEAKTALNEAQAARDALDKDPNAKDADKKAADK